MKLLALSMPDDSSSAPMTAFNVPASISFPTGNSYEKIIY